MTLIRSSTYTTRVGGGRQRGSRAEVHLSEYYNLIKVLREVDKELLKEFRKKAKAIVKPVQQEIRAKIPTAPPIRGMRRRIEPGRVTWGTGKPAKSALIRLKNPRKFQGEKRISIASVHMRSPATIIADFAGKSNKITGKNKVTPVYAYSRSKSGFRQHKLNGQGEAMIRQLNLVKGDSSRMIWPGAEKGLPGARDEMQSAINDVVVRVNAELERADGI